MTKEFSTSRGAIHFHTLLTCKDGCYDTVHEHLNHLALGIHEAMQDLNAFISKTYDVHHHIKDFPTPPDIIIDSKDGLTVHEKFCLMTDDRKVQWEKFQTTTRNLERQCDLQIGKIMEQ